MGIINAALAIMESFVSGEEGDHEDEAQAIVERYAAPVMEAQTEL